MADPSVAECEDCGARTESQVGWNRPSGVAGSTSVFIQPVQPAPVVLGHDGYLCDRCWWSRSARAA